MAAPLPAGVHQINRVLQRHLALRLAARDHCVARGRLVAACEPRDDRERILEIVRAKRALDWVAPVLEDERLPRVERAQHAHKQRNLNPVRCLASAGSHRLLEMMADRRPDLSAIAPAQKRGQLAITSMITSCSKFVIAVLL